MHRSELTVLLVRHGESVANQQNRLQGRLDSPLTARGVQQAEAVALRIAASYPSLTAVYSSPLRRAWDTARAVAGTMRMDPVAMDALIETDIGAATGLTWEEFAACWPRHAEALRSRRPDAGWPQGETLHEVAARSGRAIDEILARHSNGAVLLVSHSGTLRWLLARLLKGAKRAGESHSFGNCGITEVSLAGGVPTRTRVNDTAHLSVVSA